MDFSYKGYKEMIVHVQRHLPIISFINAIGQDKYCVIRHDVEYSPVRALKLAMVESEIGISSTYCFQLRNNCYNLLSHENLEIVRKIKALGHDIASHIHIGDYREGENLEEYILNEITTFELFVQVPVIGFSFHRPRHEYLRDYIKAGNYLNLYDRPFFQYYTGNKPVMDVVYLSDSNHQWKFGHPQDEDFVFGNRLQLNTHPFSWSENDLDNFDNFDCLTKEMKINLLQCVNNEIKNFPQPLLEQEMVAALNQK